MRGSTSRPMYCCLSAWLISFHGRGGPVIASACAVVVPELVVDDADVVAEPQPSASASASAKESVVGRIAGDDTRVGIDRDDRGEPAEMRRGRAPRAAGCAGHGALWRVCERRNRGRIADPARVAPAAAPGLLEKRSRT